MIKKMFKNSYCFENILGFLPLENPHDRCHLVQRQPLGENHMINA